MSRLKDYIRHKKFLAKRAFDEEMEVLTGKRERLMPPRRLIDSVGGGDFKDVGEGFFNHFLKVAELQPNERVLDVGCGCGRMAVPLLRYLSKKGGYWGFDITKDNIGWCKWNIGWKHRNFHFKLSDVFNQHYNPEGRFKAAEYKFPYRDGFFDFVSLSSVFTHMLADDMLNYLREISRVLKPGGRALISYFLLHEESRSLMSQGKSKISFPHPADRCMYSLLEHPEAAVAFEESFVRKQFAACGMEIVDPIFYGKWSGRPLILSYQDIIFAKKKAA